MKRIATTVFVAMAAAASAADATPPWVGDAIRLGSTRNKLEAYTAPGLPVEYTTPFLRVARAANKVFRGGRTLGAAEVDPKAWAPELRLLVGSLSVSGASGKPAFAAPKSARLFFGAGEIKASRMEEGTQTQTVSEGGAAPQRIEGRVLKVVFPVPGAPPVGGELEIRYAWARDGAEQEIVKRVPLDFRKMRW